MQSDQIQTRMCCPCMRGPCKALSIEHLYKCLIAEGEKVSQASLETGIRNQMGNFPTKCLSADINYVPSMMKTLKIKCTFWYLPDKLWAALKKVM